jgi:hypothetical protein
MDVEPHKIILGINAYHAAAAIVVDGKLVAAPEGEWFGQIKHWAGLPAEFVNLWEPCRILRKERPGLIFNPWTRPIVPFPWEAI